MEYIPGLASLQPVDCSLLLLLVVIFVTFAVAAVVNSGYRTQHIQIATSTNPQQQQRGAVRAFVNRASPEVEGLHTLHWVSLDAVVEAPWHSSSDKVEGWPQLSLSSSFPLRDSLV